MNVLGLDIGDVRTGIAYGNTNTKISTPLKVIDTNDVYNSSPEFKQILNDYMPEKFIVGLPKSLDGNQNSQALHIKDMADELSAIYKMPIEYIDERLSSVEAKSLLKDQGLSEKEMRGKIDSVAASIFLETWLGTMGTKE